MGKVKVSVLGATGMVGQRFVSLLENHPDFELSSVAASERSSGSSYREACKWVISGNMPKYAEDIQVLGLSDSATIVEESDLIFSALPVEGGGYEELLSRSVPVISKSSAHRLNSDVPLVIPGVNDDHLSILDHQKENRKSEGFISCDPNCSSTQLSIILKALEKFEIGDVFVDSMQAVSGAGYPGISVLDMQDNIVPFIRDEEEKLRREPRKILGSVYGSNITERDMRIIAKCNRVNVSDGHLQSIFMKPGVDFSTDDVISALRNFTPKEKSAACHSFPSSLIVVRNEEDRPQPRFDRLEESGMSVVAGRIEKDGDYLKLTTLSHNTILGAAGGAILHAELLNSLGLLK